MRSSGLDCGRRDASKHCNARQIPKFWGMRCTKDCNARKILKILKFRDLWPSSLHNLQKFRIFGIFRALQCLVHLMPQNFRISRAFQCLVYLRATKHCNARKIPKFWGMRCTKDCNARKIQKILKFRDLWPSSLHNLQKFRIFGIFRALQCLVHLMPKTSEFFEHFSVWCTSELYTIPLFYVSIALLLLYFFHSITLMFFSDTLLLYYSIHTLFYFPLLYDLITLVVYLCISIVLHCY